MTQLEQQMIDELIVTQGFTNDLASNLTTKGVPSSTSEGLDTLVPKVLEIESGTTKTDYELWQEGFGANWDSVIQNAPQAGNEPVLFVYNKVHEIRFSTVNFNAVTYNPTTGIYRPLIIDSNNKLVFNSFDFFVNNYDENEYVCIVLKTPVQWSSNILLNGIPLVYANTKYCNSSIRDTYINPLCFPALNTPLLRGVDGYSISTIQIGGCLEHFTMQVYPATITINLSAGDNYYSVASDTQIRILKLIVDNAPTTTTFTILQQQNLMAAIISDRKLSDWFYNDFFYKNFNGTAYGTNFAIYTKKTYKFKINSNLLLTSAYQLNCLPDCVYLEGTFTENQLNNDSFAGLHRGFQSIQIISLKNFPMWTVLEGATTGCLLPMTTTNVNNYTIGSFLFYSSNLEPKYFCEFDENGIIEDPAKYFICNLPVEIYTHANIYVRFVDLTFKNNYTEAQKMDIRAYLAAKNWNLVW